ncbi:MAG: SpoVG family protein [Lachnospiraceae bacterium]
MVWVTPFERTGSNISGLASIILGNSFAIGNISIYKGKSGEFVFLPSYKTRTLDKNGKMVYSDKRYAIPLNKKL